MIPKEYRFTCEEIADAARVPVRTVYLHRKDGTLDTKDIKSVAKYIISGILWDEIYHKPMPESQESVKQE